MEIEFAKDAGGSEKPQGEDNLGAFRQDGPANKKIDPLAEKRPEPLQPVKDEPQPTAQPKQDWSQRADLHIRNSQLQNGFRKDIDRLPLLSQRATFAALDTTAKSVVSTSAAAAKQGLSKLTSSKIGPAGDTLAAEEIGILSSRSRSNVLVDAGESAFGSESRLGFEAASLERQVGSRITRTAFERNGVLNAATTTLGTGMFLHADHELRNQVYGDQLNSWESSGIAVPMALAAGKTLPGKLIMASAALGAGHVLDNTVAAPLIPDAFKDNFSMTDVLAIGLASSVPSRSRIVRGALVGAALLTTNSIETARKPEKLEVVENRALGTLDQDIKARTNDSLNNSIESIKGLRKHSELLIDSNLAAQMIDSQKNWSTMSPEDKYIATRQNAILATASGETRLEMGSRLSSSATSEPRYLLPNANLDLGGDALTLLMMAQGSLKTSAKLSETLMGKDVRGLTVSRAETDALNKREAEVSAKIGKILGKHDIRAAIDGLQEFITTGKTANGVEFNKELAFYKTYVDSLNSKLMRILPQVATDDAGASTATPESKELAAKLLRDQVVASLALGFTKLNDRNDILAVELLLNGGRGEENDSPKRDCITSSLKLADRLAPNNPDLPELAKLTDDLRHRLEDAKAADRLKPLGKSEK